MLTVMICVMIVAFITPLAAVTWAGSEDKGQPTDFANHSGGAAANPGAFLQFLNGMMKPLSPFGGDMKFYHWVPLTRLYLLVKAQCTATDVDAVFRVNSVSSFSLGMATAMGLVTTLVQEREWNLYLSINLGTFLFNWCITLMYYGSPIPRYMATAASARNATCHFQGLMNHWAALCAREATMQLGGPEMADEHKRTVELKEDIKDRLVKFIVDKYAGDVVDVAEKERLIEFLKTMRDCDVRDYFLLVRNQVLHGMDLPGGV